MGLFSRSGGGKGWGAQGEARPGGALQRGLAPTRGGAPRPPPDRLACLAANILPPRPRGLLHLRGDRTDSERSG